jgi:serine protease AprX
MIRYAIFFLVVAALSADARDKYWIYFADKGGREAAVAGKANTAGESGRVLGIAPRSLSRRARLSAAAPIDGLDIPVASDYVAALHRMGIAAVSESRWLNAVSACLTDAQRLHVQGLPFVSGIERVKVFLSDSLSFASAPLPMGLRKTASRLDYGSSFDQVQQISVPRLHDLKITGRGVVVGMIDDGFRWRTHDALRNTHVLAEYDFIQNDTVTSNQTGDSGTEDEHGTMTLSAIGGYMPGQLIGPAFGASFLLAKTEYVPAELNIEEDHWVAGLEWLERNGADIVSTSLGYSEFDAGQHSYTYQDMNGHTAVTTKAAAVAARKGVLLCVAMGNEANHAWHYLTSPADADSIISVGAVTGSGFVTAFSSVGPTSDGRMKPEVCARGFQDVVATPVAKDLSLYAYVDGTSVATPLVAGAAALILSARPELTPMQLREALRSTASNAAAPNNSIGWGIVDAYKALLYHGLLISASLDVSIGADSTRTVSVVVLSTSPLMKDSLLYHYSVNGATSFTAGRMNAASIVDSSTSSGTYAFVLPKNATHFYITAADGRSDSRSLPYGAPQVLYDADVNSIVTPPAVPESFVLSQNFPNPFNGRTTIRYALNRTAHVSLTVYDVLGRVAAVLVNDEKEPGVYTVPWDAPELSSGVYFYTIRTENVVDTKKMILVR